MKSNTKRESLVGPLRFFLIKGWMVSELDLKGTELLVYAIIYGFSKDGTKSFNGSRQYLADFTNTSKSAVQRALNTLVNKGIIIKKEIYKYNVKNCEYKVKEDLEKKYLGEEFNEEMSQEEKQYIEMEKNKNQGLKILSTETFDEEKRRRELLEMKRKLEKEYI